jgi:cyclic-di-AMP phosphodiesterase PgpH
MISARHKAGPIAGLLLSLVFGFLFVITATLDLFMASKLPSDKPLPFTVRIPGVGIYKDTLSGGTSYRYLRVVHPLGNTVPEEQLRMIRAYEESRRPPSTPLLIGLGLAFFFLVFLYTTDLRIQSPLTGLFRTQVVLLLGLLALALVSKIYLMTTYWTSMCLPLTALIIPVAYYLGSRAAGATAFAGGMLLSLLTPMDFPLMVVLAAQGLAAGVSSSKKTKSFPILRGTVSATLAGGIAFIASNLVLQQIVAGAEIIKHPGTLAAWLENDLVGSIVGGLVGGFFALITMPIAGGMLGIVRKTTLIALANFENPLLRLISTRAPGTWSHSLSMANMAEMAANSIGADALLVRVGAYYHDVGKSVQPEYFIENQSGHNPHDDLDPAVSADAIFAHVTEGVKLARKHKIPESVIEFIYTHHGSGLLEFFWHKNMKAGNPRNLTEQDFLYPGCPPQTRETAILAVCDAVEAASRTISDPDHEKIRQLVRQIVFTKLERSALNDAGLTLPDLQKVVESLVETLRSSFHGRVKYPWQKEEPAGEPVASSAPASRSENSAQMAVTVEEIGEGDNTVIPLVAAKATGNQNKSSHTSDPALPLSPELKERNRFFTMPLGSKGAKDDQES